MRLDSNSCESISDEVGVESEFSIEVVQSEETVTATFPGEVTSSGKLADGKTTIVTDVMQVKHAYYLTFAEDGITGTAEVIESDDEGDFGEPCASYVVELQKGEKPLEEPIPDEEKK
jgi:hypothetical protein